MKPPRPSQLQVSPYLRNKSGKGARLMTLGRAAVVLATLLVMSSKPRRAEGFWLKAGLAYPIRVAYQ
eukprot:30009-Eustigmatos_ZCMA.PRE.1